MSALVRGNGMTIGSHLLGVEVYPLSSIVKCYSYRRAVMGSSLAAFRAGQRPKYRPTLVETTNPATTDQRGTVDGRLGTRARMRTLSSR